jgi:hypothetical protein
MSDPFDDKRETYRLKPVDTRKAGEPPQESIPAWLKVTLIIVIGIPLGLVVLAGLVLGVCLLGAR